MSLLNLVLVTVLTVNRARCDIITATSNTTKLTNIDSCVVKNVTDATPIRSLCDNEEIIFNLFFKDSKLSHFPKIFDHFTDLHMVDLTNTGIQHIDTTTFDKAGHLTSLYLYGSNMLIVPNYIFLRASHLTVLNIANSSVNTLEPHAFNGLSNLRHLDLSFNNIKGLDMDLFRPLVGLDEIRLMNNKIAVINADIFSNNINLRFAYFSSNHIDMVEDNSFVHTNMSLLDLANNNLRGVDISTLKHLNTLTIANNQLRTLIVPPTVENLHAENNSITHIQSSQALNKLSKLTLSWNHLLNLRNLSNFAELQFLDLSYNQLGSISFSDLKTLTKLKELQLAGNQLTNITATDVATNLPSLKMILLTTQHWPNEFVSKLNEDFKKRSIELLIDHNDIPDPKATTPSTFVGTYYSSPIPTSTTSTRSSTNARPPQVAESVEALFANISNRLNDIEVSITETKATYETKYDVLLSSFRAYKVLLVIMFIAGLMFVGFKMIVYTKKYVSGMNYRRARSADPLFSEQDL